MSTSEIGANCVFFPSDLSNFLQNIPNLDILSPENTKKEKLNKFESPTCQTYIFLKIVSYRIWDLIVGFQITIPVFCTKTPINRTFHSLLKGDIHALEVEVVKNKQKSIYLRGSSGPTSDGKDVLKWLKAGCTWQDFVLKTRVLSQTITSPVISNSATYVHLLIMSIKKPLQPLRQAGIRKPKRDHSGWLISSGMHVRPAPEGSEVHQMQTHTHTHGHTHIHNPRTHPPL